jgi:putative endonuclease
MQKNKEWHVYLLECSDGTIYCGISNNVDKRIDTHNRGAGAKYTKTRRPVKLIKTFLCVSRSDAAKLEYKIKQMSRKEKLEL